MNATPRSTRGAGDRDGIALVMAILAIILIGALVAGAFFFSNEDFRIGRNSLVALRAFAAAEYGLGRATAEWNRAGDLSLDVGEDTVVSYLTGDGGVVTVTATRLNAFTVLLIARGQHRVGTPLEIARTTSLVLRMAYPVVRAGGALTLRGGGSVRAETIVSGANADPFGWNCASFPGRDTAAVAHGVGSPLTIDPAANVAGLPRANADTTAGDDATYVTYGDETWQSLSRNADVIAAADASPTPSSNGERCTRSSTNWGEPHRDAASVVACQSYFPIVYAPSSLRLSGGRGQGILLVDGDLEIDGPIEWDGVIIVRDDVNDTGSAMIHGALLARNADPADGGSLFAGRSSFHYSACAIESALRGSARMVPAGQRAWAEIW